MVTDNFDKLVFAGCSHTSGSEILNGTKLANISGDIEVEKKYAFGAVLSKKLKKNYVNIAAPGVGNQYITRAVLLWLLNNPDQHKNVFIVVHWTGEHRIDFSYSGEDLTPRDFFNYNHHYNGLYDDDIITVHGTRGLPFQRYPREAKYVLKYLINAQILGSKERTWQLIDKLSAIIHLQELLKSLKINYLFFNAYDSLLDTKRFEIFTKHLDTSKFIEPYNPSMAFYERCIEAGFTDVSELMHHKLDAHKWYANFLWQNYFV